MASNSSTVRDRDASGQVGDEDGQSDHESANLPTFRGLKALPRLLRLDVLPFLILHPLLLLLTTLLPNSTVAAIVHRVLALLLLLLQALLPLASTWSLSLKSRISYTSCTIDDPHQTHVLAAPPPNSGQPEILEVARDGRESKHVEFQRVRYTSKGPKSPFLPPQFPTSLPLSDYLSNRGHSPKTYEAARNSFDSNTKHVPLPSLLSLLLTQLSQPFFAFQTLCCLLWSLDEYWHYALFTLIMLVFFETTVALQRQRSITRLRDTLKPPAPVFAYRDSRWSYVPGDKLVAGDVISIGRPPSHIQASKGRNPTASDLQVPCDLLLLGGSCVVNEAMLTGESVPQIKESVEVVDDSSVRLDLSRHTRHVIHGGCCVIDHTCPSEDSMPYPLSPDRGCPAFVLRTGFSTTQGSLLRTMAFASSVPTANTKDTFIFIALLLVFALVSAATVITDGLADPTRNRFKLLLHTVIIVTSVVPPELPMELALAVTASLKSLMDRQIFCTEPFRVPVAGRVDTCCFDKTGTLTSDEMVVVGVIPESEVLPALSPDVGEDVVRVMASCHSLSSPQSTGLIGEPLERAAFQEIGWVLKSPNTVSPSHESSKSIHILKRFPFESGLKRMASIVADGDSVYGLVKGAPESILPMLSDASENYTKIFRDQMAKGRRVLAMAWKELPGVNFAGVKSLKREDVENNLVFAGFLVLDCPVKDDTEAVIDELVASRHSVVMVTGDAILTAVEVAKKVGIIPRTAEVLELRGDGNWYDTLTESKYEEEPAELVKQGKSLCISGSVLESVAVSASLPAKNNNFLLGEDSMSVLASLVPHISVFARHAPRQKEAVIAALNSAGRYTLMCGDGTNDVGALKQAHVGISLISVPEIEKKKREALEGAKVVQKLEKLHRKIERATQKGNIEKASGYQKQYDKLKTSKNGGRVSLREQLRKAQEADDDLTYVALGDASVASPFTSRGTSINCVKHAIQQGRCTLVTMLQIYKILGVNCLVTALVLSRLTMMGVKQGDFQLTVTGLLVAVLFFLVSLSKPLEVLNPTRPPSTVLTFHVLLSILLQFVVHFSAIMAATEVAMRFLDRDDIGYGVADGPFNPSPLNSVVFLVGMSVTVTTFGVNYVGEPFMQGLRDNKMLSRGILSSAILVFVLLSEAFEPLNQMVQIESLHGLEGGNIESVETVGKFFSPELVNTVGGLQGFVALVVVVDALLAVSVEKVMRTLW